MRANGCDDNVIGLQLVFLVLIIFRVWEIVIVAAGNNRAIFYIGDFYHVNSRVCILIFGPCSSIDEITNFR